ncbi:hypothetical protein [Streptomyces parvulus]|uniref:hypothetical protein n=1 Tax=Streptomyces parvulus TaxID=146923 RepID=UPI0037B97D4E
MTSDHHVAPEQVYWSCSPDGGSRIRITGVGTSHAEAVNATTLQEPQQVPLNDLHSSATTAAGLRRRAGYVLDTGVIDSLPAAKHVQDLIVQRPHLPVTAMARHAQVPPTTLKDVLRAAYRGQQRNVSADVAHRLLLLSAADLPNEARGYGGQSTDAAPVMEHVDRILVEHPEISVAVVARAAKMTVSTLAATLKDVRAGRPRTIKVRFAERLLALKATDLAPAFRKDAIDATPVVEHVRQLQEAYELASIAFIAKTAGVNSSTLTSVIDDHAAGLRRGIHPTMARQVLALTELPAPAFQRRPGVTDVGLIRRLRGLCALGWTLNAIARAGSTTVKSLTDFNQTGSATPSVKAAVLAAWGQLSHRPGPSELARQRALAKRWDPPLAWEEETIDQPAAEPLGTRTAGRCGEWTPDLLRLELEFLRDEGLNWTESLARLGLRSQRAHELLAEGEEAVEPGCPPLRLPSRPQPSHELAA